MPYQRPYLVFGDIEGKLDTLRIECTTRLVAPAMLSK